MKLLQIFVWFVVSCLMSLLIYTTYLGCKYDKEALKHANVTHTKIIEEKEGCKVYQIDRTNERGHSQWPVYFTTCEGNVDWQQEYRDGKIMKTVPFNNKTTLKAQDRKE